MTQSSIPSDDPARDRSMHIGRLAQLVGRGVPPSDPRVRESRSALAYHRIRLSIIADRQALTPEHRDALADMLRKTSVSA